MTQAHTGAAIYTPRIARASLLDPSGHDMRSLRGARFPSSGNKTRVSKKGDEVKLEHGKNPDAVRARGDPAGIPCGKLHSGKLKSTSSSFLPNSAWTERADSNRAVTT